MANQPTHREASFTLGSFREALEKHEKELDIARKAGDQVREGNAYVSLGTAYHSLSDFPKAVECYEKSLNFYRKAGDRAGEGAAYLNLGVAYDYHSNFPKAIECNEESLKIAWEAGDLVLEGDAYLNLGNVYKLQSNFPKAIECYKKSLNSARRAGDRGREGDANFSLGNAYKSHSDFPNAVACYEECLNIARKEGDQAAERDAYLNLGIIYDSQSDFSKAIKCYEKLLSIAWEAGDGAREGRAYFNLGTAYHSLSDFPNAIECYKNSLNIAREAGDWSTEEDACFNLGIAYHSHSDFPKAVECFETSLNFSREAGDRAREGNAYLNLGMTYDSCGDFLKAIGCYEKSLDIAREAGDRAIEGDAYLNLGRAYDSHGNSAKAIECYEKSLKISNAEKKPADNIPVTPPEINLRGPRALEAYKKALTDGKTRLKRFPIMLIGQDRSGKTSLKKSLQGLQFNAHEDSTVGIDVDPSYFKVTTEIWKTGKRDQAASKEEKAASFEHRVARVVVENLREQGLAPDVKAVNESKDVESSSEISKEAQILNEPNKNPADYQVPDPAYRAEGANSSSSAEHLDDDSQIDEAPTKARDNSVSPVMIPLEIATLIKKLRDEVDKLGSEDDIYSVLWDFAGESVYYETHQLFLTSKAIYLLVYDLSRDPEESGKPVKKHGVFEKIEETFTKTNLEYLDFWMTTVSSQSSRIEDHDLNSASTSKLLPKRVPPVFLVCTHSDQPFGGKDPFELANKVYGFLETKSYGTQLYDDVFVVDNTKSGMQMECSEVQRLRENILDVAKELPHTREDIPIKWLKYEKALQVILAEGHKCIIIEHAEQIASEVCQIGDHQEFVTMLDFLHDQRILIHFDDTVELNKLVVLDPQWLIDVFKAVITVKPFHQHERGFKGMWLKLERYGILDEKLLRHAWGQIVEEHHTFESLIAIMEKFSLLCSWSSSDEPCSKKYLVPSMLRCHPPQEITKLIASARLPSVFLKFESGQVPSNLFPRLVTQFLQWGKNEFWSTANPQLYKNFARFYTAEDENCSVLLLCHSSLIEIVVHGGNVRPLKDDLQVDLSISCGDQLDSFEVFCAREVYRQLVLLFECLRKEFCWLKRMKYQAGVICPVCCHKRLVKYCPTHHKQDCEREECLHFIPESELRNANHAITCTRSAVAVDKVCIKDFSAWFASPRKETTSDANGGTRESKEKSLALPGKVVESLVSPLCDAKEIVLHLKENLHLDQTDLEKPTPETTRMIRCLMAKAKDSNRNDVVKLLREIAPAGTTGPLLPGRLDICDIPVKNRRDLTIDLTGGRWKVVAERLGLRGSEIEFLDERYPNPSEATLAFVAHYYGMNVDYLYDVLTECGMPVLADFFVI
ncbi:uncharacterized protein LOC114955871 isoform X2 [Acropora millepora]|uniref:uncharacterized protein LOC114955871 isoform X2 n=1 Tax=Acropora millepora TaxID=45264 RepID=UPI001CF49DF7|nr:uncharacterized protein LOC114955871 isoform X2 [Acropora millepora]